jgi:hypothetical protein
MLEEMTGIDRETLCEIINQRFEKENSVCSVCSSIVNELSL